MFGPIGPFLFKNFSHQVATNFKSPDGFFFGLFARQIMKKYNKPNHVDAVTNLYKGPAEGGVFCELGPGHGFGLECILETYQPRHVYAVEVSESFRNILVNKFAHVLKDGVFSIHDTPADNLAFVQSNSVDCIFGMNVVYFLHPLDQNLQELLRILKPGGQLIWGVSDSVKRNDPKIFLNLDWDSIVTQMQETGFVNVVHDGKLRPPEGGVDFPYSPIIGYKGSS